MRARMEVHGISYEAEAETVGDIMCLLEVLGVNISRREKERGRWRAEVQIKKEAVVPVIKCGNGKWRIGNGKCMYKTKAAADKAYKAYLAKKTKTKTKE